MQVTAKPIRLEEEYDKVVKQIMKDREWSYNKAVNYIVRTYIKHMEYLEA